MDGRWVQLAVLAAGGLVAGLWLLARGLAAYREAARLADTATSRIATLAVGEVRVSGVVEPAELTLVSPLQSAECVWYRASISRTDDGGERRELDEERGVGFRVRDATGSVRVFPRGARFDVPLTFDESTDAFGLAPPGLLLRDGSAYGTAALSREAQVAALLTVRAPEPAIAGEGGLGLSAVLAGGASGRRRYREARLARGDQVTVLGQALPFDQLPDPAGADIGGPGLAGALSDPEIAADLAAARAAGGLESSPEAAWGNAAIPGFGIGRPTRAPELDPDADAAPIATVEEAERAERTFSIAPGDVVLAASPEVPLVVAAGVPGAAVARHEARFLVGLLGAVLAIVSAIGLAIALGEVLA